MTVMAKIIQERACALGYEKCGIVPLAALDGYAEKLRERSQKDPGSAAFYRRQQRLTRVKEDFPWAKSVVVLAASYQHYRVPPELAGHIAKSYLFDIRHNEEAKETQISRAMEQYLTKLGLKVVTERQFGLVALRWAALKAGLGVIRRNNFFYTASGSYVHLEAFLIDRELELKAETELVPCPEDCDRCIKACPTGSLCAAYTMHPLRCVSFLTTFGGRDLPREPLAGCFGEWIYGCDICQDVCPKNRKKWQGQDDFPGLAAIAPALTPEKILAMDESFYREKIQPKFFYLTPDELWKWQVNALNHINRHFSPTSVPLTLGALHSDYREVREMAAFVCAEHGLAPKIREANT